MEAGLWIPIVSGIPDSLSCILDSKTQDSGFLTSLRSKRFLLVSEQKKDCGKGFSVLTAREMRREPKKKEGKGKGKEGLRKGRNVSFLSSPTPPRSFTCASFARSLTLVPHFLLLNRTETLATQARIPQATYFPRFWIPQEKYFPDTHMGRLK